MKNITLLLLLFGLSISWAQKQEALVFFKEKRGVSAAISNPLSILSQRAIDRKQRHQIIIDERDVPIDPEYISKLKNTADILVLSKSKWLNAAYVRGEKTVIEDLSTLDYVRSIEFMDTNLNAGRRGAKANKSRNKWDFEIINRKNFEYGSAKNQTEMIALDQLHTDDFTGGGMVIALMDSGFPDIQDNPVFLTSGRQSAKAITEDRLLGTYDFVLNTKELTAKDVHGSLTFSVIAGNLEEEFVGTAPDASYYLFRTEDAQTETPAEEAWWVEALERADSLGVDVVNTSLGYRDFFDDPNYNHTFEDLDGKTTLAARGANHAFAKGLLIVAAAGNEGREDFKSIGTPADSPNVLTVGAVDMNGGYAGFSSLGPTLDGRIKPDVVAQGAPAAAVDTTGIVNFVNGTSFSGPITAGAVACLWQALPNLTNVQIMQLVRESASSSDQPNDSLGYGIPNFQKALAKGQLLSLPKTLPAEEFELATNPVADYITLIFPKDTDAAQCTLYDILGAKIKFQILKPFNNKMDVSDLSKGIYIFTVKTDKGNRSFKVVKR